MKKAAVIFFVFLSMFCLTSCQGEEAGFTFTPSFETDRPVSYTFKEPKPFSLPAYQYKVQENPLKAKQTYELLKPYLASEFASDHKATFDYSLFRLEKKSRDYSTIYLPIYAMDRNVQGEQMAALEKPTQDALTALGWSTEDAPYILTSFQDAYTYNAATLLPRPLTFEAFSKEYIRAPDTNIFAVTYRPTLKGYPIYRFIAGGTEDQAAQNYASFWLSREGKIISGEIHAGYSVVKEAPIPTELISWEKAVEAVVQYAIPDDKRFTEYTINGQVMNLNVQYEVKNVEPCYIVDTNYVALPGWEITLRKFYMNTVTGETVGYRDWVTSFNAVTGQMV